MLRPLIVLACTIVLTACSGGSSDDAASAQQPGPAPPVQTPPPAAEPPASPPAPLAKADAFRFLNQATFGATESAAEELMAIGVEAWIEQQLAQPASLQLPHLQSLPRPENPGPLQGDRIDIWFRNVLHGPDQLRQRVAFALSEIMVVSEIGALVAAPYALASYYDLLAQNAFGNFRDLLEAVTLHPAMGVYLSMLGNEKSDPIANIRPDENYARELMQLFTIGLVQLEIDGTPKLDGAGQPIPTYSQPIIESFARVYTGWNYAGAPSFREAYRDDLNQTMPMQLYPEFHELAPKYLLDAVRLPSGRSGDEDLADALDNIFNHPNVGPFIAERLIQRLVASNPSRGYVARVARRFNDNGAGVRGDLAAVVEAILLDPEARPAEVDERDGKLKEPLLRLTQFWRAYDASAANGSYATRGLNAQLGQAPLQSPSVFNFFSPFYAPPGEIRDAGLVAPELEIATEYQNTVITNLMFGQCFNRSSVSTGLDTDDVVIDIDEEVAIAADPDALVDRVAEKLLGGRISPELRAAITGFVGMLAPTSTAARAAEAICYVATSPEFAVQY